MKTGRLTTILKGFGLSQSASGRFSSMIDHLICTRGVNGALLYLDSLGNKVLEDITGVRQTNGTWVNLKPWKRLCKRSKTLYRMLTKVKRIITLDSITPKQWEKFHQAATRSQPDQERLNEAVRLTRIGVPILKGFHPARPSSRNADAFSVYLKKALVHECGNLEAALDRASKILTRDLIHLEKTNVFRHTLDSLKPFSETEILTYLMDVKPFVPYGNEQSVGNISATQEPGGKLRVFASPRLLYQTALDGMFKHTFEWLYRLPNDYCHDQDAGARAVQNALKQGLTVHSVDLSNATDRFPWALQRSFLYSAGFPVRDIELMDALAQGVWKLNDDLSSIAESQTHTWTVGQPLGTKPSFAVFSLTVHALISGLSRTLFKSYEYSLGLPYAQVGDDLCIWDDRLYTHLRGIFLSLGVEISETKSISSAKMAEFAGYTILEGEIFRPGKWRGFDGRTVFSYVSNPDFQYHRCLPKAMSKLIDKLMTTPFPLGLNREALDNLSDERLLELVRFYSDFLIGRRRNYSDLLARRDLADQTFNSKLLTGDYHQFSNIPIREGCWLDRLVPERIGEIEKARLSRLRHQNHSVRKIEIEVYLRRTIQWEDYSVPFPLLHESLWRSNWMNSSQGVEIHFERLIGTILINRMSIEQLLDAGGWLADAIVLRRPRSIYDVCSLLMELVPTYSPADFHEISGSFFRLLRRVADAKDVIPQHLVPMPVKQG